MEGQQFLWLRFTTLDDLQNIMGPGHTRDDAERLLLALNRRRLLTRSPSGSVAGPLTDDAWVELCEQAKDRARRPSGAIGLLAGHS